MEEACRKLKEDGIKNKEESKSEEIRDHKEFLKKIKKEEGEKRDEERKRHDEESKRHDRESRERSKKLHDRQEYQQRLHDFDSKYKENTLIKELGFDAAVIPSLVNINAGLYPLLAAAVVAVGADKAINKLSASDRFKKRLYGAVWRGFLANAAYSLYNYTQSVSADNRANGWLVAAAYCGLELAAVYAYDVLTKNSVKKK